MHAIARKKTTIALIVTVIIVALAALGLYKIRTHAPEIEHGPFTQIDTYKQVQSVFESCDKNTLVTFDVDDTLITPRDMLLRDIQHPWSFRAWLAITRLFKDGNEYAWSRIWQEAQDFVFDPDIVQFIAQLRHRGCPIVAITATLSGRFGYIASMPALRADMLKKLGIDLSGQWPDTTFTTITHHGGHPVLHRGILCTNREKKGICLGVFLDYTNLKPAHIISFDDTARHLDSIADECARRNIPFTGYQILGAKKLPGRWDSRRARLQETWLMEHKHWLSDIEADAMLAGSQAIAVKTAPLP